MKTKASTTMNLSHHCTPLSPSRFQPSSIFNRSTFNLLKSEPSSIFTNGFSLSTFNLHFQPQLSLIMASSLCFTNGFFPLFHFQPSHSSFNILNPKP
ncbi:hypothetical protein P8452_01965 [Trifolium repens]|nr:hypothetical protein P8452_01965 [Trifolium repens]